jgi:hypothetical protein
MVNEIQPAPRTGAQADLVVPALIVASAVARARRTLARSRRIPGLSLLFIGSARGLVKVVTPHVPALPWSVGLSPALLWGHTGRGDREARAPVAQQTPTERGPVALQTPAEQPTRDTRERPHVESSAAGLEAVAPGLVLVRSLLGAPHREARSSSSAPLPSFTTRAPAPEAAPWRNAIQRRARGGWGFAGELTAALPARQPTAGATPRASRIEASLPQAAPTESARGERAIERSPAGALPHASRIEASLPQAAPYESARVDRVIEQSQAGPEVWGHKPPRQPATSGPEVLPWGASAITRSSRAVIADTAPPIEAAVPLRLPGRAPRAAPVTLGSVVEVADSLRTFVAKEVQEVKDAVSRAVASRPPEPLPQASPMPSDDTVRKLLSKLRTMMQEERFRSGKLR